MKSFFILLSICLMQALPALSQDEPVIYPNPFKDEVNLSITASCNDSLSLQIFDVVGRSVFQFKGLQTTKADTLRFEIPLQEGVFISNIHLNGKSSSAKLVHSENSSKTKLKLILSLREAGCLKQQFEVFPNPSSDGRFSFNHSISGTYDLLVFNSAGKIVLEDNRKGSSGSEDLNLAHLPDGVYLLKVTSVKDSYIEQLVLAR